MKVILLQDVKSQGKKGQVINVSDGYARNFLFPKKLAAEADASVMNDLKNKQESQKHKEMLERQNATELSEKLSGIVVKLPVASGADGRLYGSITSKDIADALEAQHNITVDKRKLTLDDPIKAYGTYEIPVKLYAEISGKINLVVCEK